ncbi:MAG: 5-formyltetrahydrofolate cyclo-ligase [Lachnospiraceae bacterium]|nr:5-formyltetrahydrofolate cyclo-ligase [Lachnospiraceae bacterium]
METKKQIRKDMLAKRETLSAHERLEMSSEIISRLKQLPEFLQAKQILIFAGYGSEPDTLPFIEECVAGGKKVFCPVVLGDEMEFFEITDTEQLRTGYKGIPEPEPSEERRYRAQEKDLMILPGVAFDFSGNRIGYGKGFYDRYLAKSFSGEMTAIAFSFQILEKERIPAEATDRTVHCIVTEKDVIRI